MYRLKFHLMGPKGWINDPNGLCQFQGNYHFFFQYAPEYPKENMKCWGHYIGKSLVDWEYAGIALYPDKPNEKDGIYSGSALIDHGEMHLFYTANCKKEGNYDYIREGRTADTVHVSSEDGIHFSEKQVVIKDEEYPDTYTNHIRDPKVWKENQKYYMVLGGRLKEEKGTILLYESLDLKKWNLINELTTKEAFGYMWECPDIFVLGEKRIISFSPQGLPKEPFRYQNQDQSGYMIVENGNIFDSASQVGFQEFYEWDMGFDFYAPQTFEDERGRRILVGWAGVGYNDYTHPSLEEEGWIHALTVPRELQLRGNKIYQYPVEELKELRGGRAVNELKKKVCVDFEICDIEIKASQEEVLENLKIYIKEGLELTYEKEVFSMKFVNESGYGRTERKGKIKNLNAIKILVDTSMAEVYLNQGEMVFTTRIFSSESTISIECENAQISVWEMKEMKVRGSGRDE